MNTQAQLVNDNIDLVFSTAKAHVGRRKWLDYGDYVTSGFVGLKQAAEKFDPSRGVKFRTYASKRIVGAIRDQSRDELGRPGRALHAGLLATHSGDVPFDDGNGREVNRWAMIPAKEPVDTVEQRDQINALANIFKTPRERMIVKMLADGQRRKDISDAIGCSDSLVGKMVQHDMAPVLKDHLCQSR